MPKVKKLVGTLTIGAALSGGVVGLGVAATTTSASAASTLSMSKTGDYREYDYPHRNRSWNRNNSRSWARNWNRNPARSWARQLARHWNRSHSRSHSSNRQAQSINIRLVFPNQLGAPVTATSTSTPSMTLEPRTTMSPKN
ncbi:hypothetical protein ACOZ38_44855 [Sphaerisporangium viridialbum]|uniref:hypothetical protein n=1 Tax=Sphaerisporangium viridialbum TaxID=46189 RepID=UPI003C75A719